MRYTATLFAVSLLTVTGCSGSSADTNDPDCTLQTQIDKITTANAYDCGTADASSSADDIHACGVEHFRAGEPWYAVQHHEGVDSDVKGALVYDGERLANLTWDSDPTGGTDLGARTTRMWCDSPSVVRRDPTPNDNNDDKIEMVSCTTDEYDEAEVVCDESL